MAFDAGMMAFSVKEMSASLAGGKVEKIYQPSRDEIIILVKNGPTRRLKISAGCLSDDRYDRKKDRKSGKGTDVLYAASQTPLGRASLRSLSARI